MFATGEGAQRNEAHIPRRGKTLVARLFTCGYEENNLTTTMWTSIGGSNPVIVTTSPHSGTYCLEWNDLGGGDLTKNLASTVTSGTYYTRFYFYISATGTDASFVAFLRVLSSGALNNWTLAYKASTREWQIQNNIGSTSATGSTILSTGTWYRFEVKHVISDTVGSIEAKLFSGDSTTPLETISPSGTDTLNTNVQLWRIGNMDTGTNFGTLRSDDFCINDATGTFQNGYPGPGKIYMIVPNADVSVQFTPNGATPNYNCVDDLPGAPDADTTYTSSATANQIDRLGLTDLGVEVPSNADIILVALYSRIRGEGTTGVRQCRLKFWDEGGTLTNGPTLDDNDGTVYQIQATSEAFVFNTGTRSKANVADFNAGYEPLTADPTRVTALWVNVEWIEAVAVGLDDYGFIALSPGLRDTEVTLYG